MSRQVTRGVQKRFPNFTKTLLCYEYQMSNQSVFCKTVDHKVSQTDCEDEKAFKLNNLKWQIHKKKRKIQRTAKGTEIELNRELVERDSYSITCIQ